MFLARKRDFTIIFIALCVRDVLLSQRVLLCIVGYCQTWGLFSPCSYTGGFEHTPASVLFARRTRHRMKENGTILETKCSLIRAFLSFIQFMILGTRFWERLLYNLVMVVCQCTLRIIDRSSLKVLHQLFND